MKSNRSGIPRIAELAGVSIGTVDRALHGRPGINDETRQRVLDIAKKIGYRPNLAARSLSTGKRIRVGVCVPQEIRYFYNEMWDGIHEEVRRYADRGIDFLLHPMPELGKGERPAFRKILDSDVRGIVVTPGNPEAMAPLIDAAEESGIRVVCVSTDAPRESAVMRRLRRTSAEWIDGRRIDGEVRSSWRKSGDHHRHAEDG